MPIFWIIIIALLVLVIIIIIAVLAIRINRLIKTNNNLQKKIITSSFVSFDEGIDRNTISKTDEDKDNPFI